RSAQTAARFLPTAALILESPRQTPLPACTRRPAPENIADISAASPFEQRNTRQPNSPPRPPAPGPPPVPSEMSDHVPSPVAQASACANPQSHLGVVRNHKFVPCLFFTAKPLRSLRLSCRLSPRRSLSYRPRPHFRLSRREKLNQPHQVIRRSNQPVQPRLFQSVRRQELRRFFLFHFRELRLQPPANRHHRGIRPPLQSAQLVPLHNRIQLVRFFVSQIQHVQHRPR